MSEHIVALRGSESTVPAMKSATRLTRAAPIAKSALAPATRSALQSLQSKAPAPVDKKRFCTSRFTSGSPASAFCKQACSNDQFEVSKGWPARHFLELSIAHCSLCLPRSQRTPNTTKSAAHATKSAPRSTTAPISCTCRTKSTSDHQNTRMPWSPQKVTTKPENVHRPQREHSRGKHPLGTTSAREPAQSECTSKISRHECAVTGSEIATHAGEHPRSNLKHRTVWGKKLGYKTDWSTGRLAAEINHLWIEV